MLKRSFAFRLAGHLAGHLHSAILADAILVDPTTDINGTVNIGNVVQGI